MQYILYKYRVSIDDVVTVVLLVTLLLVAGVVAKEKAIK